MPKHIIPTLACMALSCGATPALGQSVSGAAVAVDGDTLDFAGERYRLLGIDAPELEQSCTRNEEDWACGQEAQTKLAGVVTDREVECVVFARDQSGFPLARCVVNGLDLADTMVRSGYAVAAVADGVDYGEAQDIARQFAFGIWDSDFELPWEWRKAHPQAVASERRSPELARAVKPPPPRVYRDNLGRCAIKGNHSRYGDWIYHLPGQPYYEQTRPEARFCTEEAAQRAGYRASRAG